MNKQPNWYTGKGSGGQGTVIEETTGRTVAVAYDEKDAPLLASAPELLAALETAYAVMTSARVEVYNHNRANYEQIEKAIDEAHAAITKATGNEA